MIIWSKKGKFHCLFIEQMPDLPLTKSPSSAQTYGTAPNTRVDKVILVKDGEIRFRTEHQEEVSMKKTVLLGALTVAGLAAGASAAATLDDVKARGSLKCGVSTGLPGFSATDANGTWVGFRR